MKEIAWNQDKNSILKQDRLVGFEDVLVAIHEGFLLDVIYHPNKKKYPHQKIFVIALDNYAYLVPFVENETLIFLKTIIPSRQATKRYLIHR